VNKKPSFFDVRGAGAISDQPNNVILVWRNRAKAEKIRKLRRKRGYEETDEYRDALRLADSFLIIEKQRDNGIVGTHPLWYHPASMQMLNSNSTKPMLAVRNAVEKYAQREAPEPLDAPGPDESVGARDQARDGIPFS
jgi:hypothetical protein